MTYPVRLDWSRNPNWNEVCCWALEHFGLPGDKYVTHLDPDYMIFDFVDSRDQLLFILAWGRDN
jgi:hypothetical protein